MLENELTREEISYKCMDLLGIKYRKSTQTELQISCPFHQDKKPSCYVSLTKGVYHCFSCGRSGSVEQLFRDLTGQSLWKVLGINSKSDPISQYAFTASRNFQPETQESLKLKSVYLNFDSSKFVNAYDDPDCAAYLQARGILPEIAAAMHMKYCENVKINNTRFYRRLLIPAYEANSLISIEGRRIFPDDPDPKVLYPKATTVNTLYDLDNLDRDERLYACEGLMDLAVLRSCPTFKNSTSIFGANVTNRQLQLFSQFKEIVYIPDSDAAGQKTVEKLIEAELPLQILPLPKEVNGIPIKDIGDLPKIGLMPQDLVDRRWLNYMKRPQVAQKN